jgi:hypothetical protein
VRACWYKQVKPKLYEQSGENERRDNKSLQRNNRKKRHLEGRRLRKQHVREDDNCIGRWVQRCTEQPEGVEAKLKILGGGTRKFKGLLRRRKNAI